MSQTDTIYWKDALLQLETLPEYANIDFRGEAIHWRDAMKFLEQGFDVPLELVDKGVENIDLADDVYITNKNKHLFVSLEKITVLLRKDNFDYLVKKDIDISSLFNQLVSKMRLEDVEEHQTLKKAV